MRERNRRDFIVDGASLAAVFTTIGGAPYAAAERPTLALSNRAHFSAHPHVKDKLIHCFQEIIGAGVPMEIPAPGLAEPIMAFRFPDGGAISIEFTLEALGEQQAIRGAWLEIRSGDAPALQRRVLEAGLKQVVYPATNAFYFAAPGGQVFGINGGNAA